MTQDELIEMAEKADDEADKVLNMKGEYHPNWHEVRDEIFAKLVAAKEREACAKVCDAGLPIATSLSALDDMEMWGEKFAAAIRARGEA